MWADVRRGNPGATGRGGIRQTGTMNYWPPTGSPHAAPGATGAFPADYGAGVADRVRITTHRPRGGTAGVEQ